MPVIPGMPVIQEDQIQGQSGLLSKPQSQSINVSLGMLVQ